MPELPSINFAIRFSLPDVVKSKQVILFDDVWTTGSTIKECTKVLKRFGAKRVWALTLAR